MSMACLMTPSIRNGTAFRPMTPWDRRKITAPAKAKSRKNGSRRAATRSARSTSTRANQTQLRRCPDAASSSCIGPCTHTDAQMLLPSAMLPERANPEAPQGGGRKRTCTCSIRSGGPPFDGGPNPSRASKVNFGGGVKYEMDRGLVAASRASSRVTHCVMFMTLHTHRLCTAPVSTCGV